jgi:predicted MFS family arabinose efflux permease
MAVLAEVPVEQEVDKIPAKVWGYLSMPWIGGVFVAGIFSFSIGIMLPSMMEEIGFDSAQAGILSAVAMFLSIFLTVPLGIVANKIGPRRLLLPIFFLGGLCVLVMAYAYSFISLVVLRTLVGGLMVAVTPSLVVLKNHWVPIKRITTINGIESFVTTVGNYLSVVAIPFMMVALSGWRPIFLVLGGFILVVGVLWLLFGRDKQAEFAQQKAAAPAAEKGGSALGAVLKHKDVLKLICGWPGTMIPYLAFFTFWPKFATEDLGMPMQTAGFVLGMYSIGAMVGSLASPVLCDKIGREKPFIIIPGVITPLTYFLMLVSNDPVVAGAACFLCGVLAWLLVAPGFSLLFKLKGIKPDQVTMAMSALITTITLGGFLGPIIAGFLIQATNMYTGLAISCLGPFTLGAVAFFLPERGKLAMEKEAKEAVPAAKTATA